MNKKITIKQEALLPLGFKIFGVFMMVMGAALGVIQFNLLLDNFEFKGLLFIIIGILIILGGLVLITAHYRLTLDADSKTYHIYPWLLGYQTGEPEKFNAIEKIYINKVKLKHSYQTRFGALKTDHSITYKAFIKFDDGEKIHLDTDNNLEKMELRVAQYQQYLKQVIVSA